MNFLAVCDTVDFRNFPRRATFEAIAKLTGSLDVVCHAHLKDMPRARRYASVVTPRFYYRVLPLSWSTHAGAAPRLFARIARARWRRLLAPYDAVILNSPYQAYLVPFCPGKMVYILSDPFHLNGDPYAYMKQLLEGAHLILATSRQLLSNYLPTYFDLPQRTRVRYWPNTVDLDVWNYERCRADASLADAPTVGFAGNFMRITDLALLEAVVDAVPEAVFELAGRVTCPDPDFMHYLEAIRKRPNVRWLGHVPFDDLPRVVMRWHVGLMLDARTELASYHHHNKLYQYLALGKPVVAQRCHGDYDHLADVVLLADTPEIYVQQLRSALAMATDARVADRCRQRARENASDVRARQFLEEVEAAFG